MSDNDEIRYVSDSTLPNAGRIYDYILGGDYNFPVDRKVADEFMKKIPIIRKVTKLIRWFLGSAIDKSFKMGFTQFLDFASGLPTVDHIHRRIPENVKDKTKIIYSDIDPITVQIGREIIGINPLVKFLECDCRKPETLLESAIVNDFFNKKQNFTIGLTGIFYFLTDEQIDYITKIIYEWAPAGSIIYFCDYNNKKIIENKELQLIFKYYEEIKQPMFFRSQGELKRLIKPWRIKEPGLQILEKWLEYSLGITDEFEKETGGFFYGGFLEK